MNILYVILGVMLLVLFGYLAYEYWYYPKKLKKLGKLVRILLFEQVGKDKVFKGFYQGVEEVDNKIGVYILISSLKKAISQVQANDFFNDKEYQRCLMVVKFSDDDYRAFSRMNNEEWFRKIELTPQEYLVTEEVEDPQTGQTETILKKDADGKYIYKLDEDGQPLQSFSFNNYEEPIGVTQQDREAMRFNRAFVKRMEEKRQEKSGFWDKYGQWIMTGMVLMLMFMSCAYSNNKMAETVSYAVDKFSEHSDKIVESIKSETFIESLVSKMEDKQVLDNAPQK